MRMPFAKCASRLSQAVRMSAAATCQKHTTSPVERQRTEPFRKRAPLASACQWRKQFQCRVGLAAHRGADAAVHEAWVAADLPPQRDEGVHALSLPVVQVCQVAEQAVRQECAKLQTHSKSLLRAWGSGMPGRLHYLQDPDGVNEPD